LRGRLATGRGRGRLTGASETRTIGWGTFPRRSRTTRSSWRWRGRWATGRGRAKLTGALGTRTIRWGTLPRRSRTTRSTWRLRGRWGTGLGRAMQATTLVLPWKRISICRPPRAPSCRASPRFSAWSATWARKKTAACRCLSSSKTPTSCCSACCWGSSSRGGRWAWRRRPRDARQPWAQQRGPRRHGRP